jgi:hypothetical protein
MKILLRESTVKPGREDVFKPTMGMIKKSNSQKHDIPLKHS